jgi:glutamate synthase domain-containing protein 1
MNSFYHSSSPLVPGSLHRLSQEHDNCGLGAIAHLQGKRSHQILDHALTSVCCMTHRGAVDADMKTGDGSGVLTQIPTGWMPTHSSASFTFAAVRSSIGPRKSMASTCLRFPTA